jgi:SAM-dependent methyltransferase
VADNVYAHVLDARLPEYDDWFYRYCGDLSRDGGARHERYLVDLLRFGRVDVRGRDVLDAGSGFGLTLVTVARFGARRAVGIESYPRMVETANSYQHLLPNDVGDRITTQLGTVSSVPYDEGSFDLVLSKEAISHYRDVNAFIHEARRLLRPGGVLLIADGNNGRNPKTVANTHRIWRAFEFGDDESGPHERAGSYRLRRAEIIEGYAPDLPIEELVDRTFAMNEAEIHAACDTYRANGTFEGRTYDPNVVPLDPNRDAVIERLFDPYKLAREIAAHGFRSRVAGYWGGASGGSHVRAANRVLQALSPLTIRTAPAFWIAARRVA